MQTAGCKNMATLNVSDGVYLGADGCRGGWIVCLLNHGELRVARYDSVEAIVNEHPKFDAFLIDMAVGLRSREDQLRPDALQQPAGRVGNPMDIANMVLFLCSDKAGFISGENICIDGGMTKLMIYHGDHGWTYTEGGR